MEERNTSEIIDFGKNQKNDRFIKRDVLPYLRDLAVVLSVIILVFLLIFRVVIIEGSSMNSTLVDGDYLLLVNSTFAGEPEIGDIIVASKESYDDGAPIVKRVIATAGQEVDIDYEYGIVYVNGVALDEPYISTPTVNFEGVKFPLIVDEGCVFVMGDNRLYSKDSRDPEIGLIDCRQILGKAVFVFFPGNDPYSGKKEFSRIGGLD